MDDVVQGDVVRCLDGLGFGYVYAPRGGFVVTAAAVDTADTTSATAADGDGDGDADAVKDTDERASSHAGTN